MIAKETFIAQVDRGAGMLAQLPVTSAILRYISEQLKKGEPLWWKAVAKAWEKRQFVSWTEAWMLLLAAIHFEALDDAESPLVRYFPSCGGTNEADPAPALAKLFAELPKSLLEHLRTGERRFYSKPLAALWAGPTAYFFTPRGLPFYLVEVNAGAGLNLAADRSVRLEGFDPELVAARIGFDPSPLRIEDVSERRWLTSALFPDQGPLIVALDEAIDVLRKEQSRDGNFVQLVPCVSKRAPQYIGKNIPADDPDVGLLVYNVGVTARMTNEEYAAYASDMTEMMKPWGDRALWVEVETVRGELYSTTHQVRTHRIIEGTLRQNEMGRFDYTTQQINFRLEETAKFLSDAPQVRPR